ncbi:hypothetical protein NL676_009693 [Syzygium grande]|nr:hypothetical protein NL676_009693 [Syzygium grande]
MDDMTEPEADTEWGRYLNSCKAGRKAGHLVYCSFTNLSKRRSASFVIESRYDNDSPPHCPGNGIRSEGGLCFPTACAHFLSQLSSSLAEN